MDTTGGILNNAAATPDVLTNLFIGLLMSLITILIIGGIGYLGGYALYLWYKWKGREQTSLDSILLQVSLPRDNEIKIDAAEQFFSGLTSLHKSGRFSSLHPQPHIAFELVGKPGDIRYYIHVPKKLRDLVEKQINGSYPDADINVVDENDAKQKGVIGNEYNIFSEDGKVAFASLAPKGAGYKPLKIYKEMAVDGMSMLTSTLAKMQPGEGAAIQIMVSPADGKWKKVGRSHIAGVKKKESNPEKASYSSDPKELEAIDNKIGKPGFEVVIRVVVCSSTMEAAKAHLENITTALAMFNGQNSLKKNKHRFKGLFMHDFIYRYWPMRGCTGIMSSEELATIYHFPNKQITTPGIFWLTSKRAPAPTQIPTEGLYIGKSTFRGLSRSVYMLEEDRARHMYIIGKTGTGKSQFLKQMIVQDIENGEGICVIDPHGDLIEDILLRVPPNRAEDVIVFDPSDTQRPMGINIMEAYTEEEKHYMVSSIIGLFYKLYDPNKTGIVGPRLEHGIRNAMLTVMAEPGNTFIEVQRALTDTKFVEELLPKVTDPIIKRYWTDQIAQTNEFHKSEVLDYIVSKFGRFITNKLMRNMIGQSKSSFDFRKVMDEKKILLVNLSKGKIGEENSQFLGLILVPKLLTAAMSRQDIPFEQRQNFYLYVDEFQNFATPDFAAILSEARKYKLNLIVANQFTGQMEDDVKNAIFGNVGTIASFRVGVQDANFLQHEFQPTFGEADLINVDRFNAYIRTVVHGEPVSSFSVDVTKDMAKEKALDNPRVAELITELSRLK
ncbi:MAG TPA: type IV secretion system DNA-binding domain-containing protein, partial [Candidatus Saccharimonadales bacterium]|nr:type IV secretion system DNA-binding domain-containing protein [Candidatus Saccharimonadales bacterium]